MPGRRGKLCTPVLQMPLRQDDMEPTTHIDDRHYLRDVLLGINPEEAQKGGGGGVHTCSSLGHMATPERQAVQREGGVHRWGRLCGGGFRGSLVLPIRGGWWFTVIEFQSCGSVTNSSGDRPLHFKKIYIKKSFTWFTRPTFLHSGTSPIPNPRSTPFYFAKLAMINLYSFYFSIYLK